MSDASSASGQIERILHLLNQLRDPQTGCPWDREQTPASIAPFAIEEAYEVMEAVACGDEQALAEELGDLLLQVLYQTTLAEEAGSFDFDTVATALADKLIRRHPHRFGDAASEPRSWNSVKRDERAAKGEHGALAGLPSHLPALLKAAKLCQRAQQVGFDWPEAQNVLDQVQAELDELKAELGGERDRLEDELGDVLFTLACLARTVAIDPEAALRRSCAKFSRRFEAMETLLAERGSTLAEEDLQTLETLWRSVKRRPGLG